ncbi:catalase family peroxidase [Burkholderia cenocepacia]|uniref:catalase family peroxidase n=1 Tax=Burkholderia cenocepacia TaxID=95486 RepID=UPI0004F82FD3|nr:catalase family peroxidase [Burkholderia cenocepacia]AIO43921.1 catalase family protein [Burkholderia cepacia]KGC05386.1 catalase family protein [Burkholderia cepacia]MCG0583065.1 catalase family peroxidase [Burkholderia cenocepacia]MCW3524462.1 catalase family peroxidase [Burkholderia cenocepacia]MCW3614684.1 catalase family peroxidase [Burkholderia cenocepacia]
MKSSVLGRSLALLLGLTMAHVATAQAPQAPPAQKSTPTQLVDALNGVFGKHQGARAVHAKGIVLEGQFTPSPAARTVSKAPHFQTAVPVVVRFSDFAGIPDVADNHPLASPRGFAIKFKLSDGSDSDIVAHSFNGFPSATADDFRDLLIAIGTSSANTPKPTPLDSYLESHPTAKAFLTAPKPFPASYATLPYFGVNTFRFIDAKGVVTYGRYQFLPVDGEHYLSDAEAAKTSPNYLQSEIRERVSHGPIRLRMVLQVAQSGDRLDDPSVTWSANHRTVELGTISITKVVADSPAAEHRLLFQPNALPPGIEVEDPMINARSAAYPISFARRQQ